MKNIWIITNTANTAATLLAGAQALAPHAAITAFIQGDESTAKAAYHYGATQAHNLPLNANTLWEEDYLPTLLEKAKTEQPQLILLSTSRRCRDLAARMAAALDAPCISDAKKMTLSDNTISAEVMVYGGLAMKAVSTQAPIILATISAQTYEAQAADTSKSGNVTPLAAAQGPAKVTARQPRVAQTVNLGEATKVVGVGRGVAEQSELAIVENLAKKIGAEIACTRPIAEFYKWLPEERYLGVSGQVIKPQIYLAVGVSGQTQHYYGVRDTKTIVSINKDPDALMNLNADYYIVGDFKEVIPALEKALG